MKIKSEIDSRLRGNVNADYLRAVLIFFSKLKPNWTNSTSRIR